MGGQAMLDFTNLEQILSQKGCIGKMIEDGGYAVHLYFSIVCKLINFVSQCFCSKE